MPSLTDEQVRHFQEEGYLIVENVFDPEKDLDPVIEEYNQVLTKLCHQWHSEGKLESAFDDLTFNEKLIKVVQAGLPYYQFLDIALPQGQITQDTPIHVGPQIFNLLRNPSLVDAVESIVGPEILSNPVQHVRLKVPEHMVPEAVRNALTASTDWHQDQGVVLPEADETTLLTVWLPMTDATIEKGCLTVIPRTHRGDLATHCMAGSANASSADKFKNLSTTLHIPDSLLEKDRAIPVPVKRGSALFLHRRTKHASLSNVSNDVRWSFDLRYQPTDQPTGRPVFPGWVVRSRSNPASELRDYQKWGEMWYNARAELAPKPVPVYNRWREGAAVCA